MDENVAIHGRITIENSGEMRAALAKALRNKPASLSVDLSGAVDPATTVTTAVIESLRASRLFAFVKLYEGQDRPDYLMSGRLERLEEIDYGGSVRVEAKLSAELVNVRTGATVWTGDAAETLKIETRTVDSVVVEMSYAVEKSINRLVASMDKPFPEN